ncbi:MULTISPECIES: baseplate J/gp47 family protein [unclassified Bradyrhizobium]|uniref:baseplate J/gp47 family protein n=1 Tax=unclassified Bradyrhizobium TaxID=2631580 RepID=UPI0028EC0627|nr:MULTISPECIES: baseplate J/gp47 family protein [unclassified Bradyrhizobium]
MFAIPTLSESVERVRRSFRSYLPSTNAWIKPNNINPTSKVFGGIEHLIFQFADYIQKQKFALTADGENLDKHGEELGLSRRPARPASGKVSIVTTDALAVDAGAVLTRDDGARYLAAAAGTIAGAGTLIVPVIAVSSGADSNAIANTPLDLTSGFSGPGLTDATASVDSAGIVGGLNVEEDGAPYTGDLGTFRGRILFRKRNPPAGGSPADYVTWASEVVGVTRVFVERRFNGPGTVRVFPLMDDLYADGIPQAADIARVAEAIDLVAPAAALVTVAAPVALPVPIAIGRLNPFTTDVEEAIRAELAASFRTNSRVAGIDVPIAPMPYIASPTSFSRSWIWQAMSNAAGEASAAVSLPADDIALAPGQIPTLGGMTFAAN